LSEGIEVASRKPSSATRAAIAAASIATSQCPGCQRLLHAENASSMTQPIAAAGSVVRVSAACALAIAVAVLSASAWSISSARVASGPWIMRAKTASS